MSNRTLRPVLNEAPFKRAVTMRLRFLCRWHYYDSPNGLSNEFVSLRAERKCTFVLTCVSLDVFGYEFGGGRLALEVADWPSGWRLLDPLPGGTAGGFGGDWDRRTGSEAREEGAERPEERGCTVELGLGALEAGGGGSGGRRAAPVGVGDLPCCEEGGAAGGPATREGFPDMVEHG